MQLIKSFALRKEDINRFMKEVTNVFNKIYL